MGATRHCISVLIVLIGALNFLSQAQAADLHFPASCWFHREYPDLNAECLFLAPPNSLIHSATMYFVSSAESCADVRADIWVNGQYVGNTGWVAAGDTSAQYDVTPILLDSGLATVSLVDPLCLGDCCPPGSQLQSWSGYICLAGELTAAPPLADFPGSWWFHRDYPDLGAECVFLAPPNSLIRSATVYFVSPAEGCADVRADIWVNGQYVGNTGWVAPGDTSAQYDVTSILQESDSATVSLLNPVCAVGVGCCPSGDVQSWSGRVYLAGELAPAHPVPSLSTVGLLLTAAILSVWGTLMILRSISRTRHLRAT